MKLDNKDLEFFYNSADDRLYIALYDIKKDERYEGQLDIENIDIYVSEEIYNYQNEVYNTWDEEEHSEFISLYKLLTTKDFNNDKVIHKILSDNLKIQQKGYHGDLIINVDLDLIFGKFGHIDWLCTYEKYSVNFDNTPYVLGHWEGGRHLDMFNGLCALHFKMYVKNFKYIDDYTNIPVSTHINEEGILEIKVDKEIQQLIDSVKKVKI